MFESSGIPELPVRPAEECCILVVDDDPRIVELYTSMLSLDGYRLLTAANGTTALRLVEEEDPDVVVLDVIMPDVDGFEVCRTVKQREGYLPVILVTGVSGQKITGLQSGADDFLNKPINVYELAARVRTLLRTKQLYDQVEESRSNLEQQVKARTAELQAAYDRLQALDQVKTNVLAIVAHELRTPLMQAKLALTLTRDDSVTEEKRSEFYGTLDASLMRLEQRIEDIGVFSDPTDLKPTPASVKDLITGAVAKVRQVHKPTEGQITIEVPRGLPAAMVDTKAVGRALAHLIDNAVKFGGGKPVTITAAPVANGIQVSIEDQGEGIDEAQMADLFKPLQSGDQSSTRRTGGLGIGLALVKMSLDAHDIAYHLDTVKGRGTTVSLVLPTTRLNGSRPH